MAYDPDRAVGGDRRGRLDLDEDGGDVGTPATVRFPPIVLVTADSVTNFQDGR